MFASWNRLCFGLEKPRYQYIHVIDASAFSSTETKPEVFLQISIWPEITAEITEKPCQTLLTGKRKLAPWRDQPTFCEGPHSKYFKPHRSYEVCHIVSSCVPPPPPFKTTLIKMQNHFSSWAGFGLWIVICQLLILSGRRFDVICPSDKCWAIHLLEFILQISLHLCKMAYAQSYL